MGTAHLKGTSRLVTGRHGPVALSTALFLSALMSSSAQTGEGQQVSGEHNIAIQGVVSSRITINQITQSGLSDADIA
jgi:hypothetical protein